MEIVLFADAIADMQHWQKSGNKAIQKKIQHLLKAIQDQPFDGIGKPEALKHNLAGKWSRRITNEHRIIYEIVDDQINIYSLRGHY